MGLAGPRNKTKISDDPRNTHWATNTNNFGHRILAAHGWAPGTTLGNSSSSYYIGGHITEASNTGVKIVLKGDTLGIGCKGGIKDDECTGLNIFQNVLGRLNGKEGEVEKRVQERKTELIRGRYGMKFIRGETYISSDVDKLLEQINRAKEKKKEEEKRRRKKERKAARATNEEHGQNATEGISVSQPTERTRKEKKKDRKSRKSRSTTPVPSSESSESKTRSKKRKRTEEDSKKSKDKKSKDKKKRSEASSDTETLSSPTSGTATPVPVALTGRHAIRHRYITAKRSAVMDSKALNEIFMIKA